MQKSKKSQPGEEKAKLQNVYVPWALFSLVNILLLSGGETESEVIQAITIIMLV